MNKEDYLQSSVYCSVRHTIKAILYEKADLFLEEIMPVIEHLIEENEKLRKENELFRMQEKLRNPKTIIVSDDDWKGLMGNNDFDPSPKPEMI